MPLTILQILIFSFRNSVMLLYWTKRTLWNYVCDVKHNVFNLITDSLLKGEVWNDTVEPSKLDYHIKGLKALTDYRICVEVMYYSFTILRSEYLEIKTNRNFSLIQPEDYKGEVYFYSAMKIGVFFSHFLFWIVKSCNVIIY